MALGTPPVRPMLPTRDATAELWRRLVCPGDPTPAVIALLGLAPGRAAHLRSLALAASPEADALVRTSAGLVMALEPTVTTELIRTVGAVTGPISWSETIAARACTAGATDVFVCSSSHRAFDTATNRVLVHALDLVARTERDLRRGPGDDETEPDPRFDVALRTAQAARRLLDHRNLARVPRVRLDDRLLHRARQSRRADDYGDAFALVERAHHPVDDTDMTANADDVSRVQHGILLAVLDALAARRIDLPDLRVDEGAVVAGPVAYCHPRNDRHSSLPPGVSVAGVGVTSEREARSEGVIATARAALAWDWHQEPLERREHQSPVR